MSVHAGLISSIHFYLVLCSDIPVSVSEKDLTAQLESLSGFGKARVKVTGECHQKDYDIEWTTNGGWKKLLTASNLLIK